LDLTSTRHFRYQPRAFQRLHSKSTAQLLFHPATKFLEYPNNKVTLRGPVTTPEEKAGIVAMAKDVAGPANVDDQLEVEAKP
jgi:hypothetical protein